MEGHLHLELEAAPDGRTQVGKQFFRAPMHLSKPHWDGHTLVVQTVNCTAGIFGGDQINLSFIAKSGTRAVITSPSAQRAYPPRDQSSPALINQFIEAESGAWLDVIPEIFIPHKSCRIIQRTQIVTHRDSELLYMESMAPGRVGFGESHAFASLDWTTDFIYENRLLARERLVLHDGSGSLKILLRHSPTAYHASAFLLSPRLDSQTSFRQDVLAMNSAECLMAATLLHQRAAIIRLLAGDSLSLRAGITRLRAYLYSLLERPAPDWRKL
ncbi:MAG: urease accessory protein UreD [bacterium]